MSADVNASLPLPAAADPGSASYLHRLDARVRRVGTSLCLGIDPDPQALPSGFAPDVEGVERFARTLLAAALPYVAAVKVNLAFFEALGSPGIAALERLRREIPAEVPFIADAKRGDIGTTSARHAVALFDVLDADAVTASPFLGRPAIDPLLERSDRFVYLLCRTSNPGAGEFQDLRVGDEALYVHVARRVGEWAIDRPNVGLVVGATASAELAQVRAAAPGLPFLVPGVGAQGGDTAAVLDHGPAREPAGSSVRGGALLVNVSRGIADAALDSPDPVSALAASTADWAANLRC